MSAMNVNNENFSELKNSEKIVLLDFYADWCGPCKMLSRILDELERENAEVKFCKINVDNEPRLAAAFGVQSIPLVAFVKDNTFLDMSIGLVPKINLQKLIDEYKKYHNKNMMNLKSLCL